MDSMAGVTAGVAAGAVEIFTDMAKLPGLANARAS